mmetsp:Transcript_27363/g.26424  ORF Transcript_27363/g.26424 Transcript_27363/m.26424 type:complete len:143 (+) Transcript_27363:840-1268(+)
MSPFTSIKNIIKESSAKYFTFMVSERFKNVDLIANVTCPTFIVHGQRDTLISYRHSQELHMKCGGPSALIIPKDMDHNEFDFIDDLIKPFYYFLRQCSISVDADEGSKGSIEFEEQLYIPPADFPKKSNTGSMWNWVLRKFM